MTTATIQMGIRLCQNLECADIKAIPPNSTAEGCRAVAHVPTAEPLRVLWHRPVRFAIAW